MEKVCLQKLRDVLIKINPTIILIIDTLLNNNFDVYLVGGFTRDYLSGRKIKDVDVVTSAKPDDILNIFKNLKTNLVGKSFGVVIVNGIEVATLRKDTYFGLSDKNVKIEYGTSVEEDSKRRDLTINQIYFCLRSGKIIDYVNGQDDLLMKIIRFNGEAQHRIWEDPNRIIRACRFLAKIDGTFSLLTLKNLKSCSDYVVHVKPERIRLEIIKAMSIKKASIFFRALHEIDVLKHIFPSLDKAYLHPGGPYHIEDVFDHCMMAGDHAHTKNPIIKLTAYLHDIGKPISCRMNPHTDKIWFEGHDRDGCAASKVELENLKFSFEEINLISNLIGLHMRISNVRLQPKAIRRTLKMLNDVGISYQSLLRIAICDKMGNLKSSKFYKMKNIYNLAKDFKEQVNRKDPVNQFTDLKVNGNDIMEATGLKPGKEIGELLKYLLECVLDDPELNDKDQLIQLVKEKLNGRENM